MPSCKIDLALDAWLRFYASASVSHADAARFCYGVDAGANAYASVSAPDLFGWSLSVPRYPLSNFPPWQIVPRTCPIGGPPPSGTNAHAGSSPIQARAWPGLDRDGASPPPPLHGGRMLLPSPPSHNNDQHSHPLGKRATTEVGPLISSIGCLFCPGPDAEASTCPDDCGGKGQRPCLTDSHLDLGCASNWSPLRRRSIGPQGYNHSHPRLLPYPYHALHKRANRPKIITVYGSQLFAGPYPSCGADVPEISKWYTFEDDYDCNNFKVVKLAYNKIKGFDVQNYISEQILCLAFFLILILYTSSPPMVIFSSSLFTLALSLYFSFLAQKKIFFFV